MAIEYPRLDVMTEPLGSSAAEWSQKWFGGPTRLVQTNVLINPAPSIVLPNNPRRLFWQLTNRSANDIGISFNSGVTLDNAFLMPPNAGQISMAVQEDGESVGYQVNGISNIGGSLLVILEIMRI